MTPRSDPCRAVEFMDTCQRDLRSLQAEVESQRGSQGVAGIVEVPQSNRVGRSTRDR